MDILFFSRGRGRGHAIPDAAIMEQLALLRPELCWEFASYSTGARTFQSLGLDVYDLDLPEENPFLATVLKTYRLIEERKPRFVVAHEEFAALLAARLLQVPAVFITDWFQSESMLLMQPLAYADSILFLESRGLFDEPSYLKGKVYYLGPLMRHMTYSKADRERARIELKIDLETTLIACLPGGWATESRAPIADLILPAFDLLQTASKMLFWVAGPDTDTILRQTNERSDVVVVEHLWPIEQLIAASDMVLTKGNRGTIMEAAYLQIPSVSLSHGLNHVEDFIVPRIPSNHPLRVKGLAAEHLAACIETQIARASTNPYPRPFVVSPARVAQMLVEQLGC